MPLREQGAQAILDRFGSINKFLQHFSDGSAEETADPEEASTVSTHSEASMLLLKMGRMLEYDTFSPDAGKRAYGESLRDYCTRQAGSFACHRDTDEIRDASFKGAEPSCRISFRRH